MGIKLAEISVDDDSTNPIHQYFDAYGVIDSSRYFIIWVDVPHKPKEQSSTRFNHKIPFGFGIRERQDAFDIRAAVADQMKIIRRDMDKQSAESKVSDESGGDNEGYDVL